MLLFYKTSRIEWIWMAHPHTRESECNVHQSNRIPVSPKVANITQKTLDKRLRTADPLEQRTLQDNKAARTRVDNSNKVQ